MVWNKYVFMSTLRFFRCHERKGHVIVFPGNLFLMSGSASLSH